MGGQAKPQLSPLTRNSVSLSASEREQLGADRLRQDGTPSAHPYPTPDLWPQLRAYLVERSARSNPLLDRELTAYTPGETLDLLRHPEIRAWHEHAAAAVAAADTVVLVPCAKTKPWVGPAVSRSKLYSAYHALAVERPDICFATISEPLGIVPMERWGDFPQYDNPGLFRDDAQQSGMTKKEWEASPFGRWYGLPFDEQAWEQSIATLGSVVGRYLEANRDRRIVSFVDNATGPVSTHGEMLNVALAETGTTVERFPKRLEARVSPLSYLRCALAGELDQVQLPAHVGRRQIQPLPLLSPVEDLLRRPAATPGSAAEPQLSL